MSDPAAGYPDRTRRAWDQVQLHLQAVPRAQIGGWWKAIRQSDGTTDGNRYRSKVEATRYQLHEQQCAYLCIPPFGDIPMGELHQFIVLCEQIYDQGGRLSDHGTHIVPSLSTTRSHL